MLSEANVEALERVRPTLNAKKSQVDLAYLARAAADLDLRIERLAAVLVDVDAELRRLEAEGYPPKSWSHRDAVGRLETTRELHRSLTEERQNVEWQIAELRAQMPAEQDEE
jgi:hypothetical protein